MRAATRRETTRGLTGGIECVVDEPPEAARGVALTVHPHPLFGGTLDNKMVQTLARTTRGAARVVPERMVLVGIAVNRFEAPAVPAGTLLIHGEIDETVPLATVRDWAKP